MINRYPHTAVIEIRTEVDNGSGIPEITTEEMEIKGRYEPTMGNTFHDYSAKFYPEKKLDILKDDPRALDGNRLNYAGSWIRIIQAWNFQKHTEIWLD